MAVCAGAAGARRGGHLLAMGLGAMDDAGVSGALAGGVLVEERGQQRCLHRAAETAGAVGGARRPRAFARGDGRPDRVGRWPGPFRLAAALDAAGGRAGRGDLLLPAQGGREPARCGRRRLRDHVRHTAGVAELFGGGDPAHRDDEAAVHRSGPRVVGAPGRIHHAGGRGLAGRVRGHAVCGAAGERGWRGWPWPAAWPGRPAASAGCCWARVR